MEKHQVVKSIPATPGPNNQTVAPERSVVMSRHSRLDLAEKAARKYERDHQGYAIFRVE